MSSCHYDRNCGVCGKCLRHQQKGLVENHWLALREQVAARLEGKDTLIGFANAGACNPLRIEFWVSAGEFESYFLRVATVYGLKNQRSYYSGKIETEFVPSSPLDFPKEEELRETLDGLDGVFYEALQSGPNDFSSERARELTENAKEIFFDTLFRGRFYYTDPRTRERYILDPKPLWTWQSLASATEVYHAAYYDAFQEAFDKSYR